MTLLQSDNWDGMKIKLIDIRNNVSICCNNLCKKDDYICPLNFVNNHEKVFDICMVNINLTNNNMIPFSLSPDKFMLITAIDSQQKQYRQLELNWECKEQIKNLLTFNNNLLAPKVSQEFSIVFPRIPYTEKLLRIDYMDYVHLGNNVVYDGYLSIEISTGIIITNASSNNSNHERYVRTPDYEDELDKCKQERQKLIDTITGLQQDKKLAYYQHDCELENLRKENKGLQFKIDHIFNKNKEKALNTLVELRSLISEKEECVLTYKELSSVERKIKALLTRLEESNNIYQLDLDKAINEIQSSSKKHNLNVRFSTPSIKGDIYSVANLSPVEFEIYVSQYFFNNGYEISLTPTYLDEGIDIILNKNNRRYGVQCKYFRPDRYVSTDIILHFMGSLVNINAYGGFIATTGKITSDAQKIADINNVKIIKFNI